MAKAVKKKTKKPKKTENKLVSINQLHLDIRSCYQIKLTKTA